MTREDYRVAACPIKQFFLRLLVFISAHFYVYTLKSRFSIIYLGQCFFFAIWSKLHNSKRIVYIFIIFGNDCLKELTNQQKGDTLQNQNWFAVNLAYFAARWREIKKCWLQIVINTWNFVYGGSFAFLTILGGVPIKKMLPLQRIAAKLLQKCLNSIS